MFLLATLTAIFLGLLQKKDIISLGRLKIRLLYLPFLVFTIQYGLDYVAHNRLGWLENWWGAIHVGTYFFLFYWIYANRHLHGIRLLGMGMFLNFLVVTANLGMMPVAPGPLPEALRISLAQGLSGTHVLVVATTKLYYLADIIYFPWPFNELDSIGDLVLAVGGFWVLYRGMQSKIN